MNAVKEQLGVFVLVGVMMILILALWIFRDNHDIQLSIATWIAGVIGALINLITGKPSNPTPPSITNSIVSTTEPTK